MKEPTLLIKGVGGFLMRKSYLDSALESVTS